MSEIIQGSPEWFAVRLGKVTASRVSDVVAKTKNGWGASRANYMAQLIAERLTGEQTDQFSNAAMQWGTEKEPDARASYEFRTDQEVMQVAFVNHPKLLMSGCSPDGLVGKDGMIEVKCPNTATHIETLLTQAIPEKYITQMMWQMACTDRLWCDFVSFDPRMPEAMRLFISRVERDSERIEELEDLVSSFLLEIDLKVSSLLARYPMPQKEAA
jgi:putative phage-type endonuclease